MMSISLKINRFERLSGRLFHLLSHEKKDVAEKCRGFTRYLPALTR
jgi:hypothetical protein